MVFDVILFFFLVDVIDKILFLFFFFVIVKLKWFIWIVFDFIIWCKILVFCNKKLFIIVFFSVKNVDVGFFDFFGSIGCVWENILDFNIVWWFLIMVCVL